MSTRETKLFKARPHSDETGPTPPIGTLPITLPADVAGAHDLTIHGYNLELATDPLADLMTLGLDIDFESRFVDDKLDYLMRVGSR